MQFYLNGYKTGDPFLEDPHPSVAPAPGRPPGGGRRPDRRLRPGRSGPGGAAGDLPRHPDRGHRPQGRSARGRPGRRCRVPHRRDVRGVRPGRSADPRGLLGQRGRLLAAGPGRPDAGSRAPGASRTSKRASPSCPHVIVNQARMLAYLLDHMERSASRLTPFYGLHAERHRDRHQRLGGVPGDGHAAAPRGRRGDGGDLDDPRQVRRRLRRLAQRHPRARSAASWPATRRTSPGASWTSWRSPTSPTSGSSARSTRPNAGNILIIPREGGYLVRLYVELDKTATRRCSANRSVTPEKLVAVANRVLHPYTLELKDVGWWSVYEIGQRLCDKFDDVPARRWPDRLPRVFIAGDACHTHSAKAGQGMNVSMADTWNLGWKLAAVLRGTARPELLHTYSEERQAIAQQLIDFDREFSKMFSAHPTDPATPSRGRPGGVPAVLHHPGPLHGRRRDHYAAVDDHRRGDVPASRRGLPGRDAVPLRPGRPAGRRQAGSPRSRRPGGRRLAPLRLRRPQRPDWRTPAPASCASSWSRRVPDQRFTPAGRRPRLGDRRPGGLPAGAPRPRRRRDAVGPAAAGRAGSA